MLDMNPNSKIVKGLEQLHADLMTDGQIKKETPQRIRFLYCKPVNDSTVENLMNQNGIKFRKYQSLQDGIDEYQVEVSGERYEIFFNLFSNLGQGVYVSNERLPITGIMGGILGNPTSVIVDSVSATGTAVPLTAQYPKGKVTVRALSTNTVKALIGNATSQPFELFAGESMDISIDDLSKLYVKSSTSASVTVVILGS